MVPNMYYRLGEMDIFLLRRSGYAEEFEIKITTSDYRADIKKYRKHGELARVYCSGRAHPKFKIPNRFSYVISDAVSISGIELPVYAGLYAVHPITDRLICIAPPKTMHKHKYDWHEKVADSCSHRLLRAYKLRH